jgi:hypothetical protein
MKTLALILLLSVSLSSSAACVNQSCTSLGIIREMPFSAELPQGLDPSSITLELCFDTVCDTAQLRASAETGVLRCDDVDGRTVKYPTQCTYRESERTLRLITNTSYGGQAGSDRLVLTAIAASGARTELLRGTVRYQDTTDDSARAACTEAWQGSFTKE